MRPIAESTAASIAERLARTTLELCQVKSVTGDEAALAADLLDRCAALGLDGDCAYRVGNTVVAAPRRSPGLPTVALLGHSDTVRPAEGQSVERRDGRVYGCGASDMKGGLAVMLELLAGAPHFTAANLLCVFYDREEGPAEESGLIPVLAQDVLDGVDLALCLEPTDNRIQAGCVGGLHATVTFHGRRAHSARPWQGDNAIYAALPCLERLRGFGRREVHLSGLTFYEVMNATMAHTVNSRNVVPDRFAVNVNYRFAPGKPLDDAERELRELVAGGPQSAFQIEIIDRAPSGAVCLDHPLLRGWRDALALPVEAKQAWTDVARLTAHGIPAVNFGPGETAQAHQANESVPEAYLLAGYQALLGLFT